MKKIIVIISVLSTIILGILLGVVVHNYNDEKVARAQENEVNKLGELKQNQTIISTLAQKEKTSPNCNFKFETIYNKCGHSDITNEKIKEEDINKTEEELKEKYSEWKIEQFSTTNVKFVKTTEGICSNHYKIKDKEGKIIVYKLDNNKNENYYKETDILTKYLPENDQQSLKEGIEVNGEIELSSKLSDYE